MPALSLSKKISCLTLSCIVVGCSGAHQPAEHTKISQPQQERLFVPQEKVYITPNIDIKPTKTIPNSYNQWLKEPMHAQNAREYELFLEQNQVGHTVPLFELLRTARDWQKCNGQEYAVPNRELWKNQIATLKVLKQLIDNQILTDFEVTSVYRDLPTNACAGGTNESRHLFNSAIDFRIGPSTPKASDYSQIEMTKFKLCQFWAKSGQSLNLGLGLYASGQIHIDTQGYRTWGPQLNRSSSMCQF